MVEGWLLGLTANTVIAAAYFGIAWALAHSLTRSRQWFINPLAAATAFIFFTCGGGHAVHAWQLADPLLGLDTAAGPAARELYLESHMWAWDMGTAAIGVWYWTLRGRFPDLVHGAALFEDLMGRRKRALEIHDTVVQGLIHAAAALELGRLDEADAALEQAEADAQHIVRHLHGPARPAIAATETPGANA